MPLFISFKSNITVNHRSQYFEMTSPPPTDHRQSLSTILNQSSSTKVKIAQLQSLKSTLKTALKQKHLQKFMVKQIPKESKPTKNISNTNEKTTQDRYKYLTMKYGFRWGQQKQLKMLTISISRLYGCRQELNKVHYQLQKRNQVLEKQYQRYLRELNLEFVSKIIGKKQNLNGKLKELLCQLKNLSFSIMSFSETFHDLSKVFQVKCVTIQQNKQKKERKQGRKRQAIAQFERFQLKNENNNQILVNI